ncbi:uroporphyrinogen-III synthase [Novosphingobium sp. CF614]|uniref:uroporphyrinogen-III synthase n=1 Tax=Novosphingobium sp. CF614 TaxID=1884364 RepID=UPI0008E69BCC|nr:uroporphyrinogen-III synthase [Novosphingobium sp. CF614]SFF75629.1 uroporphyrinogen-III synthase [Novosphingobium sp. CF614]
MALPVLVLRPEPGATATAGKARAMGLDAHAFPLFAVRPLPWEPVPRGEIDAVLLGSANAVRHGGPALAAYRGLPAYAVGAKTADGARAAGLDVVAAGAGGLQPLLGALRPDHRRLLRLAGRERVELDVPKGIGLVTREVYASDPLPLPAGLAGLLARPALALLHSGEAAARFARLCDEAGIERGRILLAAIGPRVAARAGTGWAMLRGAQVPDDAALLALAVRMCEEALSGSQLPEQD